MRSTRERPSTERSLPGVNGFVITRVGSGTKRAEVFVTGTGSIPTVSSQEQGVASRNGPKGVDCGPSEQNLPLSARDSSIRA